MKVIIKNYDTNETIYEGSSKQESLSKALDEIVSIQREKDILGLGKPCVILRDGLGLGIKQIYSRSGESSSKDIWTDCIESETQGYSSYGFHEKEKEPAFISIYEDNTSKETTLRVWAMSYEEGFVLGIGKETGGILGLYGKTPAYFKKMTSKKVISSGIADAKKFKTPQELKKYIEKNIDVFKYLVKNSGWNMSIEYATKKYEEDVQKLSEKELSKLKKSWLEVEELLEKINSTEEDEYDDIPENGENLTEYDLKVEAIKRMTEMDIFKDCINKFLKDEVMMSDLGGGILYDLDENAKKAVLCAKEKGYIPYHVIHTNTSIGDLYDVLFVSKNTEMWKEERRSKKTGWTYSLCYNASYNEAEEGPIAIQPINGGVKRTD